VTTALQQSAASIYHQFVAGYDITNNDNTKEAFIFLSSIATFFHHHLVVNHQEYGKHLACIGVNRLTWLKCQTDKDDPVLTHLPQLSSFDGLLDLVALVQLMELASILSHWGYKPPIECATERFAAIETRKRARELVAVVFGTYELIDEQGDSVHGLNVLFYGGLVNNCAALTILKRQHEEKHGVSDHITAEEVEKAIKRALQRHRKLLPLYKEQVSSQTSSDFSYSGPRYAVKRRLTPGNFAPICKTFLLFTPYQFLTMVLVEPIDGFTWDDLNTGILGAEEAK
jgi:hypothetical protein